MTEEIGIKKNDILENIEVEKLVFWGKGFARLTHPNEAYNWRVIFITGWAIPGSVVNLRVIKKKPSPFLKRVESNKYENLSKLFLKKN